MITLDAIACFGKREGDTLRVTESFSVTLPYDGDDACTLVTALSAYRGERAPQISFTLWVGDQAEPLYRSPVYDMGRPSEFRRQQWRVPPMFLPSMRTEISVCVPAGTTLLLCGFSAAHSAALPAWNGGLRHNAHLGFIGIAPEDTMPAFELAAQCGFPACIVVPKLTKDGQLVCIHDDTVNRTARTRDGSEVAEPITVWDKTYEELRAWDVGHMRWGLTRNPIYRGTRIPLLSDFFALCARTGMRPMFSTHPGLPREKWEEVRDMLTKLNLLGSFHVKSFELENLEMAFSVLGEEIDGYTFDMDDPSLEKLEAFAASPVGRSACRLGIEWQAKHHTPELTKEILARGFFAAAWSVPRGDTAMYRRLVSCGVTEFTEDFHCSMGLNWD